MKLSMLVLATLACALSGCNSFDPLPETYYKPVAREISEPPLDSVSVASVGDTMVRQGTYSEHEGIVVKQSVSFDFGSEYHTVFPGSYKKKAQSGPLELFVPSGLQGSGAVWRIDSLTKRVWDQDPLDFRPFEPTIKLPIYLALTKEGELCMYIAHHPRCNKSVDVEKVMLAVTATNALQQSLIYSGKSGNKIQLFYRESSNDIARPSFNNDVEYDLSESTTIAYRGALIEVLEATNQLIRYRVIRNFNVGP